MSTEPVPPAVNTMSALDGDVIIDPSILRPSVISSVPDTFAPVCVTLNLSAVDEPSYVSKNTVFDVPDVPSILILALTLPPDCWKSMPGVFASAVRCNVMTAFVSFRCNSVDNL